MKVILKQYYRSLKKKLKYIWVLIIIGGVILIGPRPRGRNYDAELRDQVSLTINQIVSMVNLEGQNPHIKVGNKTQLYWADTIPKKTRYVLLYLHGFSASPEEGSPVHRRFAEKFGMNMYAPLLSDHGVKTKEPMLGFTGEKYLNSVKKAFHVASQMGDSVIIMSTSTGSTAALYLASGKNKIHSLICYSPNIRLADQRAIILTWPWGLYIARLIKGGKYHNWEAPQEAVPFWYTKYRLEAIVELQDLLLKTMTKETFSKIEVPTFIGYYYKNKEKQDDVVSVKAIKRMVKELKTRDNQKRVVNFEKAEGHALISRYFSKSTEEVYKETCGFAKNLLNLKEVKEKGQIEGQ